MDAVLDLFRVLFEPAAVFGRVREKPRFLAPFLTLAVITVVIGVVQLPFVKAAMTAQFTQTPNMTPEQAQTALKFAPIGVVIAPLAYCLFLLLNAFILWVGVSVFGGEAKFGTLLSVTTYASISYTLLQIVGVIVLMMRGTGGIASMVDLQPAVGLDLVAPDAKGFVLALLRGINPFTLYGLFLTSVGVAVTHQTSKATAYTAATIQFLIALLLGAALSKG
ncbi:MAG TPA: YIP1 family protein [Gemmatimonadales bacterium]|nr:YIP1 family protein [Gemmatimonadales bacterium]